MLQFIIIMKLHKKILVILFALIIFPVCVGAADEPRGLQTAGSKLGSIQSSVGLSSDISSFTENALKGFFYLLGTAFLILTIYGGFVWIKAAGRDEEVTRAKKIITTAVIGLLILLSSYAITFFVLLRIAGAPVSGEPISGPSGGSTAGLGCCMSTENPANITPMSKEACVAKGGAFMWTSSPCK